MTKRKRPKTPTNQPGSSAGHLVTDQTPPEKKCKQDLRYIPAQLHDESLVVVDEVGDSDDDIIVDVTGRKPIVIDDDEEDSIVEVLVGEARPKLVIVKPRSPLHRPALDPTIIEQIRQYKLKFPKAFRTFEGQIMEHFVNNIQSDVTFWWKMEVREKLYRCIREVFREANLVVVGSTINGCGAFTSDMDLCCVIRNGRRDIRQRGFAIQCLRKIQKSFYRNKKNISMNTVNVIQAKVPILRVTFTHPYDKLEVDLNVNNTAGINNSHLLHYYSRIDDRFPALCLLVKHWAKRNRIGEAMSGTLNSYSLILMCIHFLQVAVQPPILPNLQQTHANRFSVDTDIESLSFFDDMEPNYPDPKQNNNTVGELLIAFFDYYANFDFANWAISIKRAEVFHRSTLPDDTIRYKMFIEEPYDELNTARCVTKHENFERIMDTIREARNCFLGQLRPSLKKIGVEKLFSE